jgi:guanylate kinase
MTDETDKRLSFSRRGILLIVSAPSGAGKTTLARHLLTLEPDLQPSVSYTTRKPRTGEVDGKDYFFVSEEQFTRLREAGMFAEWAKVHEFFYGTPRALLDEAVTHGKDLLLDIDVQGARQLKQMYREAVSIFVLPPSWTELENRLRRRDTESEEVIARRLQRAREEADDLFSYDYWLVNDRVERAVAVLQGVITAERARVSRLLRPPLSPSLSSAEASGRRLTSC